MSADVSVHPLQPSGELHLLVDGDGIAFIGAEAAIESFLSSHGLLESARRMDLTRVAPHLSALADVANLAATASAVSSRWIKLTSESARLVREHGLMQSKVEGISHVMVGAPGKVQSWLQADQGLGSLLTNPEVLGSIGGVMAQVASRQAMAEVTDYLVAIDRKLDDVRRAQRDQQLSRMDAAMLAIREAERLRESVGRVSETSWSKVQATNQAILETESYALRQLGNLAEDIESERKVKRLATLSQAAAQEVNVWLAVLGQCSALQDALVDLELDRVFDVEPEEVDGHRLGLSASRQERLRRYTDTSAEMLGRIDAGVQRANARLVWDRTRSEVVIARSNEVGSSVGLFCDLLGVAKNPRSWEARTLGRAASVGSKAVQGTRAGAPLAALAGAAVIVVGKIGADSEDDLA
jgi:hypothetical protein